MIIMMAPHSLVQTTCLFPNPLVGDSVAARDSMNPIMSMSGLIYTYVKSNDRKALVFTFDLYKEKAIELLEFYKVYNSEEIRLTLWNGEVWVVKFTNDEADFEHLGRTPSSIIQLTFEGRKL